MYFYVVNGTRIKFRAWRSVEGKCTGSVNKYGRIGFLYIFAWGKSAASGNKRSDNARFLPEVTMDLYFNLKLKFQFTDACVLFAITIHCNFAMSSSRYVRQIEHKVYHLLLTSSIECVRACTCVSVYMCACLHVNVYVCIRKISLFPWIQYWSGTTKRINNSTKWINNSTTWYSCDVYTLVLI